MLTSSKVCARACVRDRKAVCGWGRALLLSTCPVPATQLLWSPTDTSTTVGQIVGGCPRCQVSALPISSDIASIEAWLFLRGESRRHAARPHSGGSPQGLWSRCYPSKHQAGPVVSRATAILCEVRYGHPLRSWPVAHAPGVQSQG